MSAPTGDEGADRSILRELVFNQYQAIVLLGVGAVAAIAASPLPLLVWAGAELVTLPLLDTTPLRRFLARRRARRERTQEDAGRAQAIAALEREYVGRFHAMQNLCGQIEENYRQLNGLSQAYLFEQRGKLDVILDGCLHRLLALQRYGGILDRRSEAGVVRQIELLQRELQQEDLPARARSAIEKNIQLKNRLLESLREARGTMKALATELDSMYSLLEVLHQNSIAMQDPQAVSQELDAIARQSEDSERVVREMEALVRAGESEWAELAPAEAPPRPKTAAEIVSMRRNRERRR
jgi:hypothetical protein